VAEEAASPNARSDEVQLCKNEIRVFKDLVIFKPSLQIYPATTLLEASHSSFAVFSP
jgi:hypothetical protein